MKKLLAAFLSVALAGSLLAACSSQSAGSSGSSGDAGSSSASSGASASSAASGSSSSQSDAGSPEDLSSMVIDPPYDFDPNEMLPKDFGPYFETEYSDCEVSTYPIMEGTDYQNEVTVISSPEDGPTIYVIAGVHGDEQAAWLTGNLLKKIGIKAGTLYILSPANPWGAAQEVPTRYVTGEEDLNRSFPGDENGSVAEQVAAAIFADVQRAAPDFVFDLHEARIVSSNSDFLGSSLIFTSLDGMEAMFMEMIMESEMGNLGSRPFNYYSPGPEGSVNNTITNTLHVPVITVETFRGYEMAERIGDQLAVVQYVMNYYGMV